MKRQSSRTIPWSQLVQKVDPKAKTERPVAYRFSKGRTFRDKRNPYA